MAASCWTSALVVYLDSLVENLDSQAWIVEKTIVFKSDAFDVASKQVAELTGLQADQLTYAACLFAMLPVGTGMRCMPNETMRHLYSLFFGVCFLQLVFGVGWIHSLISSSITYALVAALPVAGLSKQLPHVAFCFNVLYVVVCHLYCQYTNYLGWRLDFTGPHMLLTIKLSSFAWNFYDGTDGAAAIDRDIEAGGKQKMVAERRKSLSISRLPSATEFFGWVYCCTDVLAGPAFEYREYIETQRRPGFECTVVGERRIPSNWSLVIGRVSIGILCLAWYILGDLFVPFNAMYNTEFLQRPVLYRALYGWLSLCMMRGRYYFAWKLGEAATMSAGFGYEGPVACPGSDGWSKVANVDIMEFELSQSARSSSRAWNKSTQSWLQRYVYERTDGSLLLTYFVSALWHGFYPGYYLFFLSVPLMTEVGRLARKTLRPYALRSFSTKALYDCCSWSTVTMTVSYLACAFVGMTWERAWTLWGSFFYFGHVGLCVFYAFLMFVPANYNNGKKE